MRRLRPAHERRTVHDSSGFPTQNAYATQCNGLMSARTAHWCALAWVTNAFAHRQVRFGLEHWFLLSLLLCMSSRSCALSSVCLSVCLSVYMSAEWVVNISDCFWKGSNGQRVLRRICNLRCTLGRASG